MSKTFIPSPRSILAAFDQVEADLSDFLSRVPLVNEHLPVWSPFLVRGIFEACSQLDSLWKLRAGTAARIDIKDHFSNHGARVADEWLVVWEGDGSERRPFTTWSKKKAMVWWQAYNSLKHNRWENVREATLANAVDAASGLFIAIATDPACRAVLAERKWLHSEDLASDWLLKRLSTPEPFFGVTVESSLFSYAIGSSHPEFNKMLAYYNRCTRRFGKWLEAKFGREFWIG